MTRFLSTLSLYTCKNLAKLRKSKAWQKSRKMVSAFSTDLSQDEAQTEQRADQLLKAEHID
jgi:hypothetical protein